MKITQLAVVLALFGVSTEEVNAKRIMAQIKDIDVLSADSNAATNATAEINPLEE